ncbi:hypothetical protein A8975_0087 [Meridianimaribacter flavus]|uniref:Uncharacterized protein n=1 Tax=Meridianimaribacter flavus TaxID=571115 RepID=A0ABY2G7Y3_9FLAO|nr:hypothetical protein A8975_0087 [Meridianimaribacter flavus]
MEKYKRNYQGYDDREDYPKHNQLEAFINVFSFEF